jgi:glucosamine--fructose-6-phosphate aminotransferase (isomerizing)
MKLRDEIFEQPMVLQQLLDSEWQHINEVAEEIRKREINCIFLTGRGTSDNAGLYAKYLLGIQNAIPVALAAPSMFSIYKSPPGLKNTMILSISQSGQSPDIITVVKEGNRQGAMTLAITNAPESPLAQAAQYVIDVQAGVEKAVAATKTYTAELLSIAMLSGALSQNENMLADLKNVPGYVSKTLEVDPVIGKAAERYYYARQCVVVGRGYNYATAYEWALKLKELTYITAEPYSSADFLHGPIAMVEPDFPVFLIAPAGKVLPDLANLVEKLNAEKQANLLVLSNQEKILSSSTTPVQLPEMPEWVSPIVSIVPGQLFCQALAQVRGLDSENPRGLTKVTLTT